MSSPYRTAAKACEPSSSPEEDALALRRVLQRHRWRWAAAACLAGALCALALRAKPTRAEGPNPKERLDRTLLSLKRAETSTWAKQAAFERDVKAAIANTAPPPACPDVKLHGAVGEEARLPLLLLGPGELDGPLPSPSLARVLSALRASEQKMHAGRYDEARRDAQSLGTPDTLDLEVVLVADVIERPAPKEGGEFDRGKVEGRAYVYDFKSGAVVCAAEVRAASSERISFAYVPAADAPVSAGQQESLRRALEVDFDQQIQRATRVALGAPAPRE